MPIDTSYKGHDIHATALELLDTHEWEPRITISWNEGCHTMMKLPDLPRLFPTCQEAENYALVFAKKRIDSGKPIVLDRRQGFTKSEQPATSGHINLVFTQSKRTSPALRLL